MSVKGINIKDKLIQQVSEELQQSEVIVEKVINHQFKHAASNMTLHNTVEISGFGTFERSKAKMRRRIKVLEEMRQALINNPAKRGAEKKLENIRKELENYYSRI